jgi:8-oxo-dGTP diphosphatase
MFQYEFEHPAVTVDIVVFTLRDECLQLLLIKRALEPFRGEWALPGGFIKMDEDLEQSARRELREETGIEDIYLEQLYTFGAPQRDPRERVISVAWYALIPSSQLALNATTDADDAQWFAMDELPDLAFDHAEIVRLAHQRLVDKTDYSTLAFQFLPGEFTLQELQQVYETILLKTLDRRNFRKWVLSLELIEETGQMRRAGAHRPAKTYRVKAPKTVKIVK